MNSYFPKVDFQVVKVSPDPQDQRVRQATRAHQATAMKESQAPLDSRDLLAHRDLQDFHAPTVC